MSMPNSKYMPVWREWATMEISFASFPLKSENMNTIIAANNSSKNMSEAGEFFSVFFLQEHNQIPRQEKLLTHIVST